MIIKKNKIVSEWLIAGLLILASMSFVSAADDVHSKSDATDPSQATTVTTLVQELAQAKLKDKAKYVATLEDSAGQDILTLFEALLGGNLYYQKSDKKVVIVEKQDDGQYAIKDAISLQPLGVVKKSKIKKVRVNNSLRSKLRVSIARLSLFSDQVPVRRSAVKQFVEKPSDSIAPLLQEIKQTEKDKQVLSYINIALAMNVFSQSDSTTEQQITAISVLSSSLEPAVLNRLESIVDNEEFDQAVRLEAENAVARIKSSISFYDLLETVFFGLSLGSVLLLIAAGLAITFGVMGVINMAHGEMIMLGAYVTYVMQLLLPNNIGLSIILSIPLAFLFSGLVGIGIERSVIQFLKGRPLETLLATFGISLILQQAVRTVFSPLNRQVSTPDWMSGSWEINPVFALTYNRLYVLIFSILVFLVLLFIIKRTALGLYVRAVSQNRNMAKALGIRSEWVDAMTFGLGSGIAGVAGVALSQLTNVGPNMGQAYIIDSFMVVVFGGVGNLWGTLVGAFSLGVVNKFLEPVTGAVLAKILVLVFIILFIQKRPRGLFPQKGRAAES